MFIDLPILAESTNSFFSEQLPFIWACIQVALGLGFIIFVHELGHFAVAKWCGVQCDKFMVGFDIGGLKLSKKWGETEYGIGILPLGGYVKMLGQEDNVASMAEELERSKQLEGSPDAKEVTGPNGEKYFVHRRSYMAKSVPQRMAIISAGVIMNVIFAFVFAWIAYGYGVPETQCVVGNISPGGPAWEAGLMPGDRFVKINDVENPTYKDLQEAVMLGSKEEPIVCEIEKASGTTETIELEADRTGPIPMVGVLPSNTLRLAPKNCLVPNGAAAKLPAADSFQNNDQIIAINGKKISQFNELVTELIAHKEEAVTYTVQRGELDPDNAPGPLLDPKEVEITVDPNPMERLGIVPTLGKVTTIQVDSPAADAGFAEGDILVSVNGISIGSGEEGQESWDPVTLDDRLSTFASSGESVTVTVLRGKDQVDLEVTPRVATWQSLRTDQFALDTLGVACKLHAKVDAIVEGSPASEVDLQPGDVITSILFQSENKDDDVVKDADPIELTEKESVWPSVLSGIQNKSSDFKVVMDIKRGKENHTVTLTPESAEGSYTYQRGTIMTSLKQLDKVKDPVQRISKALSATGHELTSVFRFLKKIGGDIPVRALGGPVSIAGVATSAAYDGFGAFLMILVMISANLAVINFLPIPVLDGGHMVFLLWEGITGRPANEKVMIALHMVGFFFLISLMLFVFGLDLGFIDRGL